MYKENNKNYKILTDIILATNLILESNIYNNNNMGYSQFIESTSTDGSCCLISFEGIVNIDYNENNSITAYNDVYTIYIKLNEITEDTIVDIINIFNKNIVVPLINSLTIDSGIIIIGITI